jgi:SAM-dependent methyltransferase
MANDHQVDFLADEERRGPVIAVWDTAELPSAIAGYEERRRAVADRPLPDPVSPSAVREAMTDVEEDILRDPFRTHALRRYSYAWRALHRVPGPHVDIGCGNGEFLGGLAATTRRRLVGVDAHHGNLVDARRRLPGVPLARVPVHARLPFADEEFASASLLDVLEHCADELDLLEETHRVLRPGAPLVVTVPARNRLDALDPDDVKRRLPRVHRLVYAVRFGRRTHRDRFENVTDGLYGDSALERERHQHYDESEIEGLLTKAGFEIQSCVRSGLLCNILYVVAALLGRRAGAVLRPLIALDADVFASANLFVTARRVP